jgi:DNA adenine methylase
VVVEARGLDGAPDEYGLEPRRNDLSQLTSDGLSRRFGYKWGVPMHASLSLPSRPLLKWAGGKRQLLLALGEHYPRTFDRYVEPFLGSGAVFFDLTGRGALAGRMVRLADVNPDLIGCYTTLRDHPEAVIRALLSLEREHRAHGDACYYDVRDRRFNPTREGITRGAPIRYTPQLAAMLIFLNRTGFNGLFRLNRAGAFNVPAGRYTDPRICDAAHLRSVAAVFRQDAVTIACTPFDVTLADAGQGDFVYCDPPYAPLSRTASFAHYTAGGFSSFDQERLQRSVIEACRRGAQVVLSNSSAEEIVDLYRSREAREVELELTFVDARRAINSRAESRGAVKEVIVTNVPRRKKTMAKAGVLLRKARSA